MEEEETKKSKLPIALIVIVIIIMALIVIYIFIQGKNQSKKSDVKLTKLEGRTTNENVNNSTVNKNNTIATNENVNNSIINEDNTIENNVSQDENIIAEDSEVEESIIADTDVQKVIDILKNASDLDYSNLVYFKVLKINAVNGKYILELSYNSPILINENELKELKRNKTITLNGVEYQYIEDNDTINGYIGKDDEKYEITKYNDGYAFILSGIAGGYTWAINNVEDMKVAIADTTAVYDAFAGQEYKIGSSKSRDWINKPLANNIVRLNYSETVGLSIFIDNK